MSVEGLPLKLGDTGPGVIDLHRRLIQAGMDAVDPRDPNFTPETEDAVRAFQLSRRLEVDGVVDRHTWAALAEAAHRLGDRLLYHKSSPMLRGDDVAELQQRLGALGFDAGRVDGIFGPETAQALEDFQRNAGLPTDAIFGPATMMALQRLGGREAQANVAVVRERERFLHRLPGVAGRIALGEFGGLGAVADTCARRLRGDGVEIELLSHPDESHQARLANELAVDGYVALVADGDERCTVSYFATEGFESTGGARLATLLASGLAETSLDMTCRALGQRLPVLRETRMPAVVIRIGPTAALVNAAPEIAAVVADAVASWLAAPTDGDSLALP